MMPSRLRLPWLCSCFFFVWLLGFAGRYSANAQPAAPGPVLVLQPATIVFPSPEFHIAHVIDERPGPSAVAWLLTPPARPGQPAAVRPTDLRGGGLAAIRQFIGQSLPRSTSRRPLTIRLQECRVTETAAPGQPSQVDGRIEVKMALEWQREGETIALTDYRGAARYRRPLSQPAVVEPALRQSLTEAMRYFHGWVAAQAPTSLKLATGLRLHFSDYRLQTEPDTLYYDPARPLTWADFTAPARTGKYAAAVFPSFAYAGQPRVVQGILQLNLNLKVFVVRSSSWVSSSARGAYDLNHEQRHFDLVKLVAERYKHRLTPERLTLKDYNSILQYEYLVAFQEMNRVQEQYDAETHGGQDAVAQERWNRRIEAELHQYGVSRAGKTPPATGQEPGQ